MGLTRLRRDATPEPGVGRLVAIDLSFSGTFITTLSLSAAIP
jgi:hypothetical protein